MREWVSKKLKDLGTFRSSGADKLTLPGEVPVRLVNYMDVYRCERLSNQIDFQRVTANEREVANCNLMQADVLFTPSSETPDDIGHSSVVTEDLLGAVYSYHVVRFRLDEPSAFDLDFLAYVFNQSTARNYFQARATGITRYTLNRSDFNSLEICFPDDPLEQAAIAHAIRVVDKLIAATLALTAAAEQLQRGLMRELLSGRILADGTPRTGVSFTDDTRGPLPETWSWAQVKDFGKVSTGKTPPTEVFTYFDGDVPFVTPGDMGRAKWISSSVRTLSQSGCAIAGELPAHSVCVVCIGATIGKVGITVQPSATNQQINSIVCTSQHSPEYLYYALCHRSQHIAVIAGVNATPMLNKSEFAKCRLPMPSCYEEEAAIADRLSAFDKLVEAKRAKITALQRLKKSLMQNLLTGRMRLSPEAIAELTADLGTERSGGA